MRAPSFVLPILLATTALTAPTALYAQAVPGLSITVAPPALPVYAQPPIPAEGYLWTPGYWSYADGGYFWVPGTWVQPPSVGMLWTPGYWGWNGGVYSFNAGYWGPHVGFYGGIDYGFGYGGAGYDGGRWDNGRFAYNRAANNIGAVPVTNVYDRATVANASRAVNHVSYNGGSGGVAVRPTAQQEAIAHERHAAPTPQQAAHVQAARGDRALSASVNHGRPAIAATARPAELKGSGVVQARGAEPAATAAAHAPAAVVAHTDRPPLTAGAAPHAPGTAVSSAGQPRPAAEQQHPQAAVRPAATANASSAHAPALATQHQQAAVRPAEASHHVAAPHPHVQTATHVPAPRHPAAAAPHPAKAVAAHPATQKRPNEG